MVWMIGGKGTYKTSASIKLLRSLFKTIDQVPLIILIILIIFDKKLKADLRSAPPRQGTFLRITITRIIQKSGN